MDVRLTPLERAAIAAILAERPGFEDAIAAQLNSLTKLERENSGGGFYVYFEVAKEAKTVGCASPLGKQTSANVEGLKHGLGLMLWFKNGRVDALEGFSFGEDTTDINLATARFEMVTAP